MTAPSKQLDQFVVRLPEGMRDRIKAAAEAANRSMNAEIVATLDEKYPVPQDPPTFGIGLVKDFLALVESAETDEERNALLLAVNISMREHPSLDEFRIAVTEDPDLPGVMIPYIARSKEKA
jgi:hypothetical protein